MTSSSVAVTGFGVRIEQCWDSPSCLVGPYDLHAAKGEEILRLPPSRHYLTGIRGRPTG